MQHLWYLNIREVFSNRTAWSTSNNSLTNWGGVSMFKRAGTCIINCTKTFKNSTTRTMYIKKYYKGVINKNWSAMELLVFINRHSYLYRNHGITWIKQKNLQSMAINTESFHKEFKFLKLYMNGAKYTCSTLKFIV